jgi:hypothetical protein
MTTAANRSALERFTVGKSRPGASLAVQAAPVFAPSIRNRRPKGNRMGRAEWRRTHTG